MQPEEQIQLLRRFEPVMRFNKGENFFPMDVGPYLSASSLWMQKPGSEAELLLAQGEVNTETLSLPRQEGFETVYYLRFIEPVDLRNLIAYLQQKRKERKELGIQRMGVGRLARVGYGSRFADLLFSLSLLLRGRVPGDTSAAAVMEYSRIMTENEHYRYHGRVFEQNGWVVLQYWFFYAFNNWRSAFFGVNDHEADWESIHIFLYKTAQGEYVPEWVAYSAHEFVGEDLRRRWDDPELQKVGEHPVIFVGAGSHASYFSPGEYLAEIELHFLSRLSRLTSRLGQAWSRFIGREENGRSGVVNVFRIPFVDYARGDGLQLGAEQQKEWSLPVLIEPPPAWISQYRGLWGLYARDPIAGENAPAGPMYGRFGDVRRTWCDPVGWCGLDKVPPPDKALDLLRHQKTELLDLNQHLDQEIEQKNKALTEMGLVSAAIRDQAHMRLLDLDHSARVATLSNELAQARAKKASNNTLLESLELYEQRLLRGERDPARAHIRLAQQPASETDLRVSRLVELWSALSIGLLMIGFVGLVLFSRQHMILGLIVMISVFVFLESGFRRQLAQLINSMAVGLAVVCALIILWEHFWIVVVLGVLFAGVYILWENLREFLT
ncbi:MAG: hypothetical protein JXB15_15070 [Anaerolineales bacterium]|nr:hypothetical protein [Anaerolineales bacterium]